jgi:hypothetical protein
MCETCDQDRLDPIIEIAQANDPRFTPLLNAYLRSCVIYPTREINPNIQGNGGLDVQ